jgi:hypothetical protein
MVGLGLTSLALEWPEELAPAVDDFLADGTLADHESLWTGDGRITAGHLALLAERATAGQLRLILFDGTIGADWKPRCHSGLARCPSGGSAKRPRAG